MGAQVREILFKKSWFEFLNVGFYEPSGFACEDQPYHVFMLRLCPWGLVADL